MIFCMSAIDLPILYLMPAWMKACAYNSAGTRMVQYMPMLRVRLLAGLLVSQAGCTGLPQGPQQHLVRVITVDLACCCRAWSAALCC